MISEVIVFRFNEQFDWIIRKQVFKLLPLSLHNTYLELQFFLLLFSITNVIVLPMMGIVIGIAKKNVLVAIASIVGPFAYYFLLLKELGDGII